MRVLAGGGMGSLVAIVILLVWGGLFGAESGNVGGGALMALFCFGGFAIPLGFLLGCCIGAVAASVRKSSVELYSPELPRARRERRPRRLPPDWERMWSIEKIGKNEDRPVEEGSEYASRCSK